MCLSVLLDLGQKQTLEIRLEKGPINTRLTDQSLSTRNTVFPLNLSTIKINHVNMETFWVSLALIYEHTQQKTQWCTVQYRLCPSRFTW